MARYTLFYHPHHVDSKKAERLLHIHNIKIRLSDVTTNGISSYIFKDMGISELPALCMFLRDKYEVYEGLEEIQAFVEQGVK